MNPENTDEGDQTSDTPHEGTDATTEEIPEDPTIPSLIDAMGLPGVAAPTEENGGGGTSANNGPRGSQS